jgi:hypothetical protein
MSLFFYFFLRRTTEGCGIGSKEVIKNAKTMKAVRGAEVDFLYKYDTLSSSVIFNIAEWERHKNLPIGLNITRDGVLL